MPVMPPQPPACPQSSGLAPVPTAAVNPAPPVFPTPSPDPSRPLNGLTDGDNSFSGSFPEDCRPTFTANVEYLDWWLRDTRTPPLVTTGSANDRAPGALGEPGTRIIAGGDISTKNFDGARVSLTYWFPNPIDPCSGTYCFASHDYVLDIDGNVFALEQRSHHLDFASNPNGTPVLSRPFINAFRNSEDADAISLPHVQRGSIAIGLSDKFMGGEANVRLSQLGGGDCGSSWALLAGARALSLDQKLFIDESAQDLPPLPANGKRVTDQFTTYNRFYGGQVGGVADFYWGGFLDANIVGKVAVGYSPEVIHTTASTFLQEPGLSNDRGLLVQPSNFGRFSRTRLTVVPELTATLGARLSQYVRVYAGYNLIYWSEVVSPGEQIDRPVSIQAVPTPRSPEPPQIGPRVPTINFTRSDFWAQGIVAGVEFTY
jgi:hypothetical protein